MAENKKSVLLYCDLIHTVESLTDLEAGKLFKHYLRYINDLNPESDDRLTTLLFEPIKQNLKRDLKKWEKKSERNSEIAKAGWVKRKDANAYERMRMNANHADTDTVKDTVTVNVTDTDKVNVKEKKINIPTISEFLDYCKTIQEINFNQYEFSLKTKYETWVDSKWIDGNGKKIKNWKTKIKSVIPYLKPTEPIKAENKSIYSNYPKI